MCFSFTIFPEFIIYNIISFHLEMKSYLYFLSTVFCNDDFPKQCHLPPWFYILLCHVSYVYNSGFPRCYCLLFGVLIRSKGFGLHFVSLFLLIWILFHCFLLLNFYFLLAALNFLLVGFLLFALIYLKKNIHRLWLMIMIETSKPKTDFPDFDTGYLRSSALTL